MGGAFSVNLANQLPKAIAAINIQAAERDISPDEASLIVSLLEAQRKEIETADLAERLHRWNSENEPGNTHRTNGKRQREQCARGSIDGYRRS